MDFACATDVSNVHFIRADSNDRACFQC
jgi:hypothetical protein